MKRLDAGIAITAVLLVIALIVGTLLFHGNIDEWGASLASYTQETRSSADALRQAATEGMRANPDGFYRLEMRDGTVVRYYLFWRIHPADEELPGYLRESLGDLAGAQDVDAVAEAASATVHLFSWNNRDRQLLGRWFRRRGIEGVEVELFVHGKSGNHRWRRVGMLDEKGVVEALDEADLKAVRQSRFNRVVVIPPKETP